MASFSGNPSGEQSVELLATTSSLPVGSSSPSGLHHRKSAGTQCKDEERLEDLDQEDQNRPSKISTTTDRYRQPPPQKLRASWLLTEAEHNLPGFWSWITSSRTTTEHQRQLKAREEYKKHDDQPMDPTGMSTSEQANKSLLWDTSRMIQGMDMTWRDWVVLSSMTIVTIAVRLWRISLPDGVV